MASIIIGRVVQLIPVVLLATGLVFVMVRLAPGDPAHQQLGSHGARDSAPVGALRHQLRLDKPIAVQCVIWLRYAVTGDLGRSVKSNKPVQSLIRPNLAAILELILAAIVSSVWIQMISASWLPSARKPSTSGCLKPSGAAAV